MKISRPFFSLCASLIVALSASAESPRSPFEVRAAWRTNDDQTVLRLNIDVPSGCVLYSDRLHFETGDQKELTPVRIPDPVAAVDKATGHEKKIYGEAFSVDLPQMSGRLIVKFQGCTNAACYFPDERVFNITPGGTIAATTFDDVGDGAKPADDWRAQADQFRVAARESGYVTPASFVKFLDDAASGKASEEENPLTRYKRVGLLATLFLIVLGGLGLNLTPCILPLIPINLAIIGAGKSARSRRAGFINGATYGGGMALAYGILGVVVVLTGAKFGTLNSSFWFNALIAVVFLVLSLAMFGKLNLDLSRFESGLGDRLRSHKSQTLVAFGLGTIAALLAGACVAPVVISVLLLSTSLYGKGVMIGLSLPFFLGAGMALPWPFMGASLSMLPKPGRWMVGIKYGFGTVILLFAIYYGHLAYGLLNTPRTSTAKARTQSTTDGGSADPDAALANALKESHGTGKPVFVDFKASWCKNCTAMDETVFNQENVRKHLQDFIVVQYPAEHPNESPAREVLDRFNVLGLPTYVVLKARN